MPPKGKQLTLIDLAVIDALRFRARERGLGTRALSRESGIGLNRTGIILRAEGPAPTVGELDLIAGALGTTASEILLAAEKDARRRRLTPVDGIPTEEYGLTPPAPLGMAAQGEGVDMDAEQEGSQETP